MRTLSLLRVLLLLIITPLFHIEAHATKLLAPNGKNYQWRKDNVIIAGANGKELTVEDSGLYTVKYLGKNNEIQTQIMRVTASGKVVVIHLIGDSTVENMDSSVYPCMGWGQKLGILFDTSHVQIDNAAISGRSSKSFYEEGRWKTVKNKLQAGDYVFIQFGHNDATQGASYYAAPYTTYKDFLTIYINDTRAKGAIPVLCTPVSQSLWEKGKVVNPYFPDHVIAMRELATALNVPLIDLNAKTKVMMEVMGQSRMNEIFMILEPGQYPNFPDGSNDVTHFQENGALKVAELVVTGLKELDLFSNNTGSVCTYSISPTSVSPDSTVTTGSVIVTADSGCTWTVVNNSKEWLTVTSSASGSGNGIVDYSVAANPGTARTGTITIAWQTFAVNQAGNSCTYTISPISISHDTEAAATGSVAVTSNRTDCAWTAVSNATAWLTVTSGASGSGNGTVGYSVATNTGAARTGTITVAEATFIVHQAASPIAKTIVLVTDSANGNDDAQYTWLTDIGFAVTRINIGSGGVNIKAPDQATINQMNAANLVIVGRSANTSNYDGAGQDVIDNITVPVISNNSFGAQWGVPKMWFANASNVVAIGTPVNVTNDLIFANSNVVEGAFDYCTSSVGTITDAGTHNGAVIGTIGGNIAIVRFAANVAYHSGGKTPKSERTIFATDEWFSLTADGLAAYLAEINRLTSVVSSVFSISPTSVFPTIYPNPAIDFINVEGLSSGANVYVLTMTGQLVSRNMANGDIANMNLSKLSSGMYLIKVDFGGKVYFSKIFKQ